MLVNTPSLVEAAFRGVDSTDLLKQEVDEATVRAKYGADTRRPGHGTALGHWGDSENLNYAGWLDAGTADNEQIAAVGHSGSKSEE